MIRTMILIVFLIFSILLISFAARIIIRGISIVAKPPIHPAAFAAAKLCAFSSCLFIPAGFFRPELNWLPDVEWLPLLAVVPLCCGIVLATISMKKLGDDLIFGLPKGGISALKTDGIFRFSRNPLYLGFILIILSSCMITPNPFNAAAGILAVALHHLIILQEEQYLRSKLGKDYFDYSNKTGRYLLGI